MGENELKEMVLYLRLNGFLKSEAVERALLSVDRYYFVPENLNAFSYKDLALPIGHGQTISAPSVVALMLEKLEIKDGMNVLEVGTGSGYNAALLAELVGPKGRVTTIETLPELAKLAKENIKKLNKDYENIEFVVGDGSKGYPPNAPYDAIAVTAAMPWLDKSHPLIKQLAPHGKLIAPVGDEYYQNLILYDRKRDSFESVLPVVFVPLVGEYGFKKNYG
jgi:protein-L-isoaspartate(D-aspartate) O-methyltransferase